MFHYMPRRFCIVKFLFVMAMLCTGGCRQKRPPWAEEYYPDYIKVKTAYLDLAYDVRTVNKQAGRPITSFEHLTTEIQKRFPDTKVTFRGLNPFPELLPTHTYQWFSSWERVTNRATIPLIWTTVKLRDPTILCITTSGEIVVENRNAFQEQINNLISLGAKLHD